MAAEYSKHAGFRDFFKNPMVQGALATTAVSTMAGAAQSAYEKHQDTKQRTHSYKTMLELHPHLRKRDSKQVRRLFSSLNNVNPSMAKDPLVAGAWVDNVIETNSSLGRDASNQALIGAVKDMADIRQKMMGGRASEMRGRPSAFDTAQGLLKDTAPTFFGQGKDQAIIDSSRNDLVQRENALRSDRKLFEMKKLDDSIRRSQKHASPAHTPVSQYRASSHLRDK